MPKMPAVNTVGFSPLNLFDACRLPLLAGRVKRFTESRSWLLVLACWPGSTHWAGQSGLGKTTFLASLFPNAVKPRTEQLEKLELPIKTEAITPYNLGRPRSCLNLDML